ncbi:MAG: hypothetical protein P4L41_06105 [Flavipsychrobacter sp.]|nr:hypothetical protein [Flavipsychrobacter sp.]
MSGFLKPITIAVRNALNILADNIANSDNFNGYLRSRGWLSNAVESDMTLVHTAIDLDTAINNILDLVEKVENGYANIDDVVNDAIPAIQSIYNDINALGSFPYGTVSLFPLNQSAFWTELGGNLFDDVFITYLQGNQKILFSIFHLVGIIQFNEVTPTGANRIPYIQKTIQWNQLGNFITGPLQVIKTRYSWGLTTTNYDLLYKTLERIFKTFNVDSGRTLINESHYNSYYTGVTTSIIEALEVPLYESFDPQSNNYEKIGLSILPAPNGSSVAGIMFIPEVTGIGSFQFQFTPELLLKGEGYFSSSNLLGYAITPNGEQLYASSPSAAIGAKVTLVAAPYSPWILLGTNYTTRLMLSGIETSLQVSGNITDPEFVFSIGLGDTVVQPNLLFVFEPGDGDNFLQKLLGDTPFEMTMGLGMKWSSKNGISFSGSGGFEITIPINQENGSTESEAPIRIDDIIIKAGVANNAFSLGVGANISFTLGFLSGVIDNIGINASLIQKSSSDSRGILNDLDYQLNFKPPNGVGISIDADAVTGGGYLYFDEPNGRYYGAAQLKILDKIDISAVGIITTKLPDGSNGYSFLLLVNVTFAPSIPIGFGFSLSGVGGLVGINRDMNPQPLRDGVRNGAINNIMFPDNVVSDIDHLIGDLESYFPAKQNRYTFGLFFLLDWGMEVPIITIKLGLMINMPDPVRLAILGNIEIALPDPDDPLLELNIAFIGIIDFDNKYMTFDASIYNSRLLSFTLSGDMAVRMFWGDHKEMVLSVGGFHPAFNPPSYLLLPANMNRLTISIFDESDLKLKFSTYFAFTSNTLQFGAEIDFLLKVWKLQVVGYFGFDVLFQLNPFHFTADIHAGLAVKWGSRELLSISMDITLDGPGLWHAKGSARFKVLFVKKTANLDKTWGNNTNTTLPSVTIKPLILASLNDEKNWQADLPVNKTLLVNLRPLSPATAGIVLHPLGILSVGQNVVPLNTVIERFGSQKPTDGGTYDITDVKIAGASQPGLGEVDANFAPAQFRNMSDDQKLKAASFEFLKSGASATATDDWSADLFIVKKVKYNTVVIDQVNRFPAWGMPKMFSLLEPRLVNSFASGGLISSNSLSIKANTNVRKPIYNVSLKQEQYKLVSADSLSASIPTPVSGPLSAVLTAADAAGPTSFALTASSY